MNRSKSQRQRRRMVLAVLLGALLLSALVLLRQRIEQEYNMKTTEGRCAYLASLGYETEEGSEREQTVKLPKEFGEVMEQYNLLQRSAGFDLEKYAGKSCTQYTYTVTNAGLSATATAVLYVRGGTLIGGDIHSASLDGSLLPLVPKEE